MALTEATYAPGASRWPPTRPVNGIETVPGRRAERMSTPGTATRWRRTLPLKDRTNVPGSSTFSVKVVPDWRENPQKVRELDWHFQLEGLSEDIARKSPADEDPPRK